jgi:hypothetical protein
MEEKVEISNEEIIKENVNKEENIKEEKREKFGNRFL